MFVFLRELWINKIVSVNAFLRTISILRQDSARSHAIKFVKGLGSWTATYVNVNVLHQGRSIPGLKNASAPMFVFIQEPSTKKTVSANASLLTILILGLDSAGRNVTKCVKGLGSWTASYVNANVLRQGRLIPGQRNASAPMFAFLQELWTKKTVSVNVFLRTISIPRQDSAGSHAIKFVKSLGSWTAIYVNVNALLQEKSTH